MSNPILRKHIEDIFRGVFEDIDKLVDDQIQSAKTKDLAVTVRSTSLGCEFKFDANPVRVSFWLEVLGPAPTSMNT